MAHIRTQIRSAVAALISGLAPIEGVYVSRRTNIPKAKLPAATIMLTDEDSENVAMGAIPTQDRAADLQIEIRVRSQDEDDPLQQFDAVADACAQVIEVAIAESENLGGLLKFSSYSGMTSEYSEQQPEGVVTLAWRIHYFTRANTPDQSA